MALPIATSKKVGRKEWIDLRNRLWFANKPQSVKLMGHRLQYRGWQKAVPSHPIEVY